MKKSDLRTGMKVVTRGGTEFIVYLNTRHGYDNTKNILVCPEFKSCIWKSLDDCYNEDLKHYFEDIPNKNLDIMKVYIPIHPYDLAYKYDGYKLIWERQEKRDKEIEIENLIDTLKIQLQYAEIDLENIKNAQ